jgi:G3E family GTPase
VVDCFNFIRDFSSLDTLQQRKASDLEGDTRTLVNLLTDQIEFANVILLNKTDLVSNEQVGMIRALIQKLNADAIIYESNHGKVPLRKILNTGLFDFDKTSQSAGWIAELNKQHTPETEEYGITSFVFRDKRPFHPERFWDYLNQGWHANIIRSKGLFWIASRPNDALNWSQAGGSLKADRAGVWWCSMNFGDRIHYPEFVDHQAEIEKNWSKRFGDRQNELVIIGQEMDEPAIRAELEACLCTEEEVLAWEANIRFKDPFPVFP